jgi:hypothetical protein
MPRHAKRRSDLPAPAAVNQAAETLGDDLLVGITNIAKYLKQPKRRVQNWHDTQAIPTDKTGGLITTTKSKLNAHFGG